MPAGVAAAVQIALVVVILAVVHVPLGDYLARILTPGRSSRPERGF